MTDVTTRLEVLIIELHYLAADCQEERCVWGTILGAVRVLQTIVDARKKESKEKELAH